MDLLLLSFAALAAGPLLVVLARRAGWSTVAVDSFCVVALSGLALLHLLPECAAVAGWPALALCLLGFLAPLLVEKGLHRRDPTLRRAVLVLCILGIAVHASLDGLAVYAGGCHHGPGDHEHAAHETATLLAWGVILHRIPEGVGIWWIVPRTLGRLPAILLMCASVAASLFGYFLGPQVIDTGSQTGMAMLQALLAGSLLHVVLHAHVPAPSDATRRPWHVASVLGALAAAAVLWVVTRHVHAGEGHSHTGPGALFLELALESAPALLFAFLLVGLSQAFLPDNWLHRSARGSSFMQALRGVAIGLPLPVCSCGVVPIYHEMVRRGAAMAAAIAFLVATPELEIAAALLTWKLLGGELALVRIGAAALLALGVGMLVGRFAQRILPSGPTPPVPAAVKGPLSVRLRSAVQFGFGPAVDNVAPWILMGLLLSALLMPFVSRDWIRAVPDGIEVPVAALLGLPIYVCATGSTPLAAMLVAQGLSPGAAVAFLLTGPATNVTTFGILARLHGKGIALLFGAAMLVGAVILGFAVNLLVPAPAVVLGAEHEHGHPGWEWAALVVVGAVFLASLLRLGVRPFLERLFESPANVAPGDPACCAEAPVPPGAGHHHDHGHEHAHDHGPGCGHDHAHDHRH